MRHIKDKIRSEAKYMEYVNAGKYSMFFMKRIHDMSKEELYAVIGYLSTKDDSQLA